MRIVAIAGPPTPAADRASVDAFYVIGTGRHAPSSREPSGCSHDGLPDVSVYLYWPSRFSTWCRLRLRRRHLESPPGRVDIEGVPQDLRQTRLVGETEERGLIDPRLRNVLRVALSDRGDALADLIESIFIKKRDRARSMLDDAARMAGVDVASLVHHLAETERRLALLEDAVRQAQTTYSEDKRGALAKVVALGARDDARLDYAELLLAMLDGLEAPHVKALQVIAEPYEHDDSGAVGRGGWTNQDLVAALPGLQEAIDLIVVNLESRGFIRNSAAGTWGGIEGMVMWNSTPAGDAVMTLLNREHSF